MITKSPPTTSSPRRLSVEQFERYAASTDNRCELIRGIVHETAPANAQHGDWTNRLNYYISRHVYENHLGRVYIAETGFRLHPADEPPTVRAPDIAFISRERAAQADIPHFAPIPPDLVVETLSPSDSPGEAKEKIAWWLEQGVREAWVFDHVNQTITVHGADRTAHTYHRHDTLDSPQVLPGFELDLKDLFD